MENKPYTKVISAGIIIYRKTKDGPRFLLLYRGRNTWDFPRGGMEGGERSWQTAFREVGEETGLRRADLDMQQNFKAYEKFPFSRGREKFFKIVIFYLAETKTAEVKISSEHQGFGWFSYNEARRYLSRYPARVALLRKALGQIREPQQPLPPPSLSATPSAT